jgi:hypothetical protein
MLSFNDKSLHVDLHEYASVFVCHWQAGSVESQGTMKSLSSQYCQSYCDRTLQECVTVAPFETTY